MVCVNLESAIYKKLDRIFGNAVHIIASRRPESSPSPTSDACPWEEPARLNDMENPYANDAEGSFTVQPVFGGSAGTISETPMDPDDPLDDLEIPEEFEKDVFRLAEESVKHTVWMDHFQRYMQQKAAFRISRHRLA